MGIRQLFGLPEPTPPPAPTATLQREHRPSGRVLMASASRVMPSAGTTAATRRDIAKWQADAWVYRRAVPECRYAINFLANAASQIRIHAAELIPGQIAPDEFAEDTELPGDLIAAAHAAMDRLTGGRAMSGNLLGPLVNNLETVGEAYLVGYTDADGIELWGIYSIREVQPNDDGFLIRASAKTGATDSGLQISADSYVERLWSPDPEWHQLADSPMRALLDVCEELLLIGRAYRAAFRNRVAGNGILKVPTGLYHGQPDAADTDPDGFTDASEEVDRGVKFISDLTTAMVTPIGDESAASAVVPLVITGDKDELAALDHLTLDRPMDKQLVERESKALRRLGTGLDVPPEIVTGMADVNHWTAWQVDDSTFRHHVEPIVLLAVDSLTIGYLRPTLRAMGTWTDAQVNRIVCWYDASRLVADPDRGQAARDAHAAGVINDAALRRELQFGDDDAPDTAPADAPVGTTGMTAAHVTALLAAASNAISVGGFDPAAVLAALGLPAIEHTGVVPSRMAPTPTPPGGEDTAPPAEPADTDTAGPPPGEQAQAAITAATADDSPAVTPTSERLSRRLMDIDRRLRERLTTAADAAITRALERAGNRVRSKAAGDDELRASLVGIDGPRVAATIGRDAVTAALGLDEAELLADAFASLRTQWAAWTDAAQAEAVDAAIAISGADRDSDTVRRLVAELYDTFHEAADAGWAFLETGLSGLAAERLYTPDPAVPEIGELPDGIVSPSLIRGALAIAGGLLAEAGGLQPDGVPAAGGIGLGGIGTGEIIARFTRGQGSEITEYEWAYGISTRPFLPHAQLDGQRFTGWDDTAVLSTAGTGGEWVGGTFAVGDHKGCHCDYLPVWSDGKSQRDALNKAGDEAGGAAADARNAARAARRAARTADPVAASAAR